ncbi:MAG: SDR family oxidoreductase [Chromatiales bacterium]|jgi:3-oxoacyl-[acyl-carrier protein] reductase|nr:SDR family oxidoreductase [Chromatiales bacterium]
MRLQDRRAIVSGAASGIGRATARLFAKEGAQVLAIDRPGAGLEEQFDSDASIFALAQDISAPDAGSRIVAAAMEQLGGIDILYNNAGVSGRQKFDEMTDDVWDRVIDVNLNAGYRLTRAAVPALKESAAGRIIFTASVMARMTDYGLAAYCASKAGIAGLTRSLALDLGKYGITANYVEPGAILTGMTKAGFEDPHVAQIWAKKAALRRLGEPLDLAKAVLFLASDDAAFVTGHGLTVDGGLTLRT